VSELFDTYFLLRSGNLQTKGNAGNGMSLLGGRVYEMTRDTPGVRVEWECWDDSPRGTAEWIYRFGRHDPPPAVIMFCYSYGCGYGFVRVARELKKLGIPIKHAVLCDPVHYSVTRWRSLIQRTPIIGRRLYVAVPSNVQAVTWFRQRVDLPSGHDLRFESADTINHGPTYLQAGHTEMDNQPEFHAACEAIVLDTLHNNKGTKNR